MSMSDIHRLVHGPIFSTLLRLAVPSVLAMAMQVLVGIAETIYIGRLGTAVFRPPSAAPLARQISHGPMLWSFTRL